MNGNCGTPNHDVADLGSKQGYYVRGSPYYTANKKLHIITIKLIGLYY